MGTVLSNHSTHQDIKMKFLIPLLVVLATSDAFFLGFGRNPDARDVDIKDTDTEELARLLGEILVKELRNNNYNNHHNNDHDDDDDDDDDDENKNHHNNNNNRYNNNNNNTPKPVHTYTPRPLPTFTPEPIHSYNNNNNNNNNKYNNNNTPRPVHTYTPEPIVTIEPDHIIYNAEPEPVHKLSAKIISYRHHKTVQKPANW